MFAPQAVPPETTAAIKAHALASYPNEMCGVITPELTFLPLENRSPEPTRYFDCVHECNALQAEGRVAALVHSHPDGPDAPSALDVAGQLHMDVPWGLVLCSKTGAADPYYWSDAFAPPPLEGREFRHGPSGSDGRGDCGALIRDYYRLQRGVILPDFAREDGWWQRGEDLYERHFEAAGFRPVREEDVAIGDVLLFQFRSDVPNHGGIYFGNGLILHHLAGRLSRVESVIGWMKLLRRVLRHAG